MKWTLSGWIRGALSFSFRREMWTAASGEPEFPLSTHSRPPAPRKPDVQRSGSAAARSAVRCNPLLAGLIPDSIDDFSEFRCQRTVELVLSEQTQQILKVLRYGIASRRQHMV